MSYGRGKRQISAEEGRVEKQEGKADYSHKQPESSPDWVLLGLRHLREPSFHGLCKVEELSD